jgi:hypothetical protein
MSDQPIKHIEISQKEYSILIDRLVAEYGLRIRLSWVSRRELGFSIRTHRPRYGCEQIYLDFFDAASKTFFLLKYFNHE